MPDISREATQDRYGRPIVAVRGRLGGIIGWARDDQPPSRHGGRALAPTPDGAYPWTPEPGEPVPVRWTDAPNTAREPGHYNAGHRPADCDERCQPGYRPPMARPLTAAERAALDGGPASAAVLVLRDCAAPGDSLEIVADPDGCGLPFVGILAHEDGDPAQVNLDPDAVADLHAFLGALLAR